MGNRSSSGFRHNAMFHPDLVSPLSLAPLLILVPGSDVFVTLQFQQVGLIIRISLSRVAPGPRAFALLQLHQKDGPQKHWLNGLEQPHSKRPAQQPPSHSASWLLCPSFDSKTHPAALSLLFFSTSLSRPRLRLRFTSPASSLHAAVLSPAILLRLGFVIFSGFSTNFGVS